MLSTEPEKLYPSSKTLVKDCVASRLHAKDATLYGFSDEAQECAANFMGWVDLASNPPCSLQSIKDFAADMRAKGLETVVLIGQGGSTQASMTITKYNKTDSNDITFKTIDSDSPVRIRSTLAIVDPMKTLFVISSKSGGTIEPRTILAAVREWLSGFMSEDQVVKHLCAITDPGSKLAQEAEDEGWAGLFLGEPTVGGRYSALSVFGLLPAALAGIDIDAFIAHGVEAERMCSEDAIDNPAIDLAAFLYDNYLEGRNKFSFLTQKRGRVLGLWIEQLVAESLGKEGQGILPNIEVDSLMLAKDPGDRSVIMYKTKNELWDEIKNFEMSLSYVDPTIPRMNYRIESVEEVAEHFVMWEYAIAMCGYLMKVCPFDQPDVASAKAATLGILTDGAPEPDFCEDFIGDVNMGTAEVRLGPCFKNETTIHGALKALLGSVKPGDYFAVNAFLPFTGEWRREALEDIRHGVASKLGVVSCMEIGPRYLHSTGQLQKGGMDDGVFLIISADEVKDIPVTGQKALSLGALAEAEATGDFAVLSERGRRCMQLHLPDNAGITLRRLAEVFTDILEELQEERKAEAAQQAAEAQAAEAE